jgi:hypothetical protein
VREIGTRRSHGTRGAGRGLYGPGRCVRI